jgi:membrane-associated phospholipid phosphatase
MRNLNNPGGLATTQVHWHCWALAWLCIACGLFLHGSSLNQQWLILGHRNNWLPDQFWLFVTQWGDSAQALVLLLTVFMQNPVKLAWVLKTWLMGMVASPLLKKVWDAPRPLSVLDPQWLHPIGQTPMGGNAMPSGHSLAAGSLAALLFFALDRDRPFLRCMVVLLCSLIALSRLAVGAHWPADVLVGLGLGVLLVLAAQYWEQVQPWSAHLTTVRAQSLLAVLMLVLVYALWHLPSEGWGMTGARLLVSAAALWSLIWFFEAQRKHPKNAGGRYD